MKNKILTYPIILILLTTILFSGCIENEPAEYPEQKFHRLENEYSEQHKPIKEMTTDLRTISTISGSYLLIGGSVYGTIDTQRFITLIYQVNINNETYHKYATLPIAEVDFFTIGKNESSYLTIREHEYKHWYIQTEDYIPLYDEWQLKSIRLYLPEGWQIINTNDNT